ncbi:MlaD family protein [Nocardioides sp. TRM66260-LWL]|uniref:MlaD family protein n=1 Tax=Nocardioides sp. TRM66260-LWL TaxID=2874478 RepID=UPI001CC7CD06|nr:MlaD family protein [Nocardioides sp. TRM66260-LWL]MBZ5735307.1 MlaD family protein [Nocardioides sp. TRM66260-LWL]
MVADTGSRIDRRKPVAVVLTIVLACALGFVYLFTRAGGHLPGQDRGYEVSFRTADLKNVQPDGEVRIAGVKVGSVVSQRVVDRQAEVTIALDPDFAPLHRGAKVRIGVKSVIGQSFVEVTDGDGPELPAGSTLTGRSVVPAVDIDEVISTFDPTTRRALSGFLTRMGRMTTGTKGSVDQLLTGLGDLGRGGYTAVDALQAQSTDLQALVREANTILGALNTGRDQIGQLVRNADTLTRATSSQQDDLARTVQRLPALLDAAGTATGTLDGLGADLDPVARDLDAAAPDLRAASTRLPSVTSSLRGLLPAMDASLGRAPATLDQVPALSSNLTAVAPQADYLLRNVSPMVAYMRPWMLDLGSFFGNFGASFDAPIENGVQPVRLAPIFNEYSLRNNPLKLTGLSALHWVNPYPSPGGAASPKPYRGTYPRVEMDR